MGLATADGHRDDAHSGTSCNSQLAALVVEPAVGVGERLAEGAECARREVVVVVVLERFQRLCRRAPDGGVASGDLCQQEEAALGPYLGANRRLPEAEHVARVGGSLLRHREPNTSCESIRHAGSPGIAMDGEKRGPDRCRL